MELESFNLTDRNSEDKIDDFNNFEIMNPEEQDTQIEFKIKNYLNKFEDEFEIISDLGKGHSGNVYKCFNRINKKVIAVKCSEANFK